MLSLDQGPGLSFTSSQRECDTRQSRQRTVGLSSRDPPQGGKAAFCLWAEGDNSYLLFRGNAQMHRTFNTPWEPPVLSSVMHLRCLHSTEEPTSPLVWEKFFFKTRQDLLIGELVVVLNRNKKIKSNLTYIFYSLVDAFFTSQCITQEHFSLRTTKMFNVRSCHICSRYCPVVIKN